MEIKEYIKTIPYRMAKGFLWAAIIIPLSIIFAVIFAEFCYGYTVTGNGNCDCCNCSDCTNALNDGQCYNEVSLTNETFNQAGTCIDNPANFSNKIFNCHGYELDGTGSGYGIYLDEKHNNIIKNCYIMEFTRGIYLYYSDNNKVLENGLHNNEYGIYVYFYSENNNITGNNIYSNSHTGIVLESPTYVRSNTIHNNNEKGIYLDLSNNNYIGFNNIYENTQDGIYLHSSSYNNITNNSVNDNNYGIYLYSSSNNNITNNTANSNNYDGIYLTSSSNNNAINTNKMCSNEVYDINRETSCGSNTGDNNAGETYNNWNDEGDVGLTFNCNNNLACHSCNECVSDLNISNYDNVDLECNIYNLTETCINNPANFNNKKFDCQGHIIDGNDTETGIVLKDKYNISILRCNITQWYNGISIINASGINITNNTLHHIRHYPLYFENSTANITNNTFYSNSWSRGYKALNSNLSWTNNTILVNYSCADDTACTGTLLFVIITGGLAVWYYRRT